MKSRERSLASVGWWCPDGQKGQGTVEFAVVTGGLLVIAVVCGLLWRAIESGLFVEHALSAASHHVCGIALGALSDVFLY